MSTAPRILIVEDEAHLAEGLLFNLQVEGYEAAIAGDGEAALAKLASEPFDAVLLDVMLPGKSGFEVVTELRAAAELCAGSHVDRSRAIGRRPAGFRGGSR